MITDAMKRVQKARTALLLDQPFFGVLALQLTLKEDTTNKTAWTDGKSLGFNPEFVAKLSNDELKAVLAHEVMHCACGHPWRRDARTMSRWNQAADYAINSVLRDAGFKLPSDALLDPQYDGKASEWIYDRLPEDQKDDNGNGQGDGSSLGDVRDAPSEADAPTESEWQQLTQQSAQSAKARGQLPESMARAIDEATKPRTDWRSLLRRFVQDVVKADYTWTRPNRRYAVNGLYLPSLHSHACGRIAIAVDTSGSIDKVLLKQFAAELRSIFDEVQPASVDVLYCDSMIHRVDTFTRDDYMEIKPVGGGGTAFEPVFERLQDDPPSVLIYFTDLDGSFPQSAPDYPVIWAATSRSVAPFGETVPCE